MSGKLRRRRPLLRAAMVGGAGYAAGRNVAERKQQQATKDEEIDELQRTQSAQAAPAALQSSAAADALVELESLLDSGVLTQEEFDTKKRQILQEG